MATASSASESPRMRGQSLYQDPRTREHAIDDPLQQADPWSGDMGDFAASGQLLDSPSRRPPAYRPSFIGTGARSSPGVNESQPRRSTYHDLPPDWDGLEPQKFLEPYLKLLHGWLLTTNVNPKQQGLLIMQYAAGELRQLLDNLDLEELTQEDSGMKTLEYIKKQYSEFIVAKKPVRIEEAFYDADRCRRRGEGLLTYITRRKRAFHKVIKRRLGYPR
jgi:hypothetical protein